MQRFPHCLAAKTSVGGNEDILQSKIAFENNEGMPKTFGSDFIVTGQKKKLLTKALEDCEKKEKRSLLARDHGARSYKIIYPLSVNAKFRTEVKQIRIGCESDSIRLCTYPIHIRLV